MSYSELAVSSSLTIYKPDNTFMELQRRVRLPEERKATPQLTNIRPYRGPPPVMRMPARRPVEERKVPPAEEKGEEVSRIVAIQPEAAKHSGLEPVQRMLAPPEAVISALAESVADQKRVSTDEAVSGPRVPWEPLMTSHRLVLLYTPLLERKHSTIPCLFGWPWRSI
jgi:hypothetical protein